MPKLFMMLIGCKPAGRNTEQHDVYFGIGESIKDMVPKVKAFWPEANGKIHFDAWREVTLVNGYSIKITEVVPISAARLFFINLGGYKPNEFEEFHYKLIMAAKDKTEAINASKQTAFFMHTHFAGAESHIDDKYGIDVDDMYEIEDILDKTDQDAYFINVQPAVNALQEDELHLGYFKLSSLT